MRLLTRHADLSNERLAVLAHDGDRGAAAALRSRLHGDVYRVAFALLGDVTLAGHLARSAIDEAIRAGTTRVASAALANVQRHAVDHAGGTAVTLTEGFERAVLVLYDDDGLSFGEIGEILGLPVEEVVEHHRRGRMRLDVDAAVSRCRGWSLVSRLGGLTDDEAAAAGRHLALCRGCAAAREAQEASRSQLQRAIPAAGAATGLGAGVATLLSGVPGGVLATAGALVVAGAAAIPVGVALAHTGGHVHAPGAAPVDGAGAYAAGAASGGGAAIRSAPTGSVGQGTAGSSGGVERERGLLPSGAAAGPAPASGSPGDGGPTGVPLPSASLTAGVPTSGGDPVGTVGGAVGSATGAVGGVVGGVVGTVTSAAPLPTTTSVPLPSVSLSVPPLPTVSPTLTTLPTVSPTVTALPTSPPPVSPTTVCVTALGVVTCP